MKKLLLLFLLFFLLPAMGWTETLSLDCTSTPGGTTYNWASIESGFNYNDAAGYTYTIVPRGAFGGLGMGIIYGF